MKRRQWTSQEKLKIVLEGLSGQISRNRTGSPGNRLAGNLFSLQLAAFSYQLKSKQRPVPLTGDCPLCSAYSHQLSAIS